nr:hypothetical protein B0A51_07635 [Rachicladosporium sp. CCFEE 5018]
MSGQQAYPILERRVLATFITPRKRIEDGNDLAFFHSSIAYRDIKIFLLQLNRAIFPRLGEDGNTEVCDLQQRAELSSVGIGVAAIIKTLSDLVDDVPPETGPRRFGNVAFRTWYKLAESKIDDLFDEHLGSVLDLIATNDDQRRTGVREELKVYLLGGFGSAQRMDYGTGHELSFLVFLGCLWKLSAFRVGEERTIVTGLIQPYLVLMRKLILTYTLEPAGTHGVWGLDDHSFLPYIFGSAQLGPAIASADAPTPLTGSRAGVPKPDSIASKNTVLQHKDNNMYFAAIQFIYDVKTGPFWEHSPTLFNISGIKDGWAKINKGMIKMYDAEVLGKFPVVQHFPFGSLFPWEKDPAARQTTSQSVHAQQQPSAQAPVPGLLSGNVQTARPQAGTAAPWAKPGAVPSSVPSTGVPSTRAPWAAR